MPSDCRQPPHPTPAYQFCLLDMCRCSSSAATSRQTSQDLERRQPLGNSQALFPTSRARRPSPHTASPSVTSSTPEYTFNCVIHHHIAPAPMPTVSKSVANGLDPISHQAIKQNYTSPILRRRIHSTPGHATGSIAVQKTNSTTDQSIRKPQIEKRLKFLHWHDILVEFSQFLHQLRDEA